MRTKILTERQDCVLLMMLRTNGGAPITTGTATVKLNQDFGSFSSIDSTGTQVSIHNPPRGTLAVPDTRWNPGVDGPAGFNVEVTIPDAKFASPGTYFASITLGDDAQTFRIHVSSGWDGV